MTPRGGRNAVGHFDGTTLFLRVAAPPVEGAANRACAERLAHALNVRAGQITLIGGGTGRNKRFAVRGITEIQRNAKLAVYRKKESEE